jgi:putative FmdB family regulatory protein
MPIYDYLCTDCGATREVLVTASDADMQCTTCGSRKLKKLLSAHSSYSGSSAGKMPGAGDTACCGSSPGHAGCAGPGSCCGKNTG